MTKRREARKGRKRLGQGEKASEGLPPFFHHFETNPFHKISAF